MAARGRRVFLRRRGAHSEVAAARPMSEPALIRGADARSGESPLALRALAGGPADVAAMQSVFAAAPGYFEAIQGGPAGPAEGGSLFTDLPPGRSYADKIIDGLCGGDALVGCADVVRGWNGPDKASSAFCCSRKPGRGAASAARSPRSSSRRSAAGPRLRPCASASSPRIPAPSRSGAASAIARPASALAIPRSSPISSCSKSRFTDDG